MPANIDGNSYNHKHKVLTHMQSLYLDRLLVNRLNLLSLKSLDNSLIKITTLEMLQMTTLYCQTPLYFLLMDNTKKYNCFQFTLIKSALLIDLLNAAYHNC